MLLTAAENKRDSLSIILAGYKDEIEGKLYASDAGFKSRFRQVKGGGFVIRGMKKNTAASPPRWHTRAARPAQSAASSRNLLFAFLRSLSRTSTTLSCASSSRALSTSTAGPARCMT